MCTPIFPELPNVCTGSFRILLRTLAGAEDFASATAHYLRRTTHPRLRNSTWDRSCLYRLYHYEQSSLDSEWHGFLRCSLIRSSRREFTLLAKLQCFLMFRRIFCVACYQGPGRQQFVQRFLRVLPAKYVILVSIGFDSSPPKPLSSGLLNCLRRVSTFSSYFVHSDPPYVSF